MYAKRSAARSVRASPAHISSVPTSLRNAFPGYFALVMATGIVSIALADQGFAAAAWTLFAINAIAYVLLWGCGFARLAAGVRGVLAELADHRAGPAFLTVVAGTCVLGVQCLRLAHWPPRSGRRGRGPRRQTGSQRRQARSRRRRRGRPAADRRHLHRRPHSDGLPRRRLDAHLRPRRGQRAL